MRNGTEIRTMRTLDGWLVRTPPDAAHRGCGSRDDDEVPRASTTSRSPAALCPPTGAWARSALGFLTVACGRGASSGTRCGWDAAPASRSASRRMRCRRTSAGCAVVSPGSPTATSRWTSLATRASRARCPPPSGAAPAASRSRKDNVEMRRLIAATLRADGCEVVEAGDGAELISRLEVARRAGPPRTAVELIVGDLRAGPVGHGRARRDPATATGARRSS